MEKIEWAVAGSIMILLSIWDVWRRKIPCRICLVGFIVRIPLQFLYESFSWMVLAAGVVPGVILLVISYLTREKIGYGDGWGVAMLGWYVGIWNIVQMLSVALLLSAVYALGLLVIKKVPRDKEIPFLPFLLVGLCGGIFL
ncbi:MAG: A24 family peptidase [Lachnospiraceae bacterium]|nr:A24 family peptidase [Lachnospiraceae bacterium]MDD3614822.1 A24 family peptidase [Lachnospiraceae bacterium]